MDNLTTQIVTHMDVTDSGQVWMSPDFAQLDSRDAADQALQRLSRGVANRAAGRSCAEEPPAT